MLPNITTNAFQACRVCGARVPSGFTNCDSCYQKGGDVEEKILTHKKIVLSKKGKQVKTQLISILSMFFLGLGCLTNARAEQTAHSAGAEILPFKAFGVYSDAMSVTNHYSPSGFMGDYSDIKADSHYAKNPHSGSTSIRIEYSNKATQGAQWAGIYWQNPANNWGSRVGGYDLTGATKLTFWARGEKGGERIEEFKAGGLTGEYQDSDVAGIGPVILTNKWQQYTIDLTGKDLTSIAGGFCWAANLNINAGTIVFFLDDIQYE